MGILNSFAKSSTAHLCRFYIFLYGDGSFKLSTKGARDTYDDFARMLIQSFKSQEYDSMVKHLCEFAKKAANPALLPQTPMKQLKDIDQDVLQRKVLRLQVSCTTSTDQWNLRYAVGDLDMFRAKDAMIFKHCLAREFQLYRQCSTGNLQHTLEELVAEIHAYLKTAQEVDICCSKRKGSKAFDMLGETEGEVLWGAMQIIQTVSLSPKSRDRHLKAVRKQLPEIRSHLTKMQFDRACPDKLNTALIESALAVVQMEDVKDCPCQKLLGTEAEVNDMNFSQIGPCLWQLATMYGFYVHRSEQKGNLLNSWVECPCCGRLYERQEEEGRRSDWSVAQKVRTVPAGDPAAERIRREGNRFAFFFSFSSNLFDAVCTALGRYLEDQGFSYSPSSKQATGKYDGFTLKIGFYSSHYNVNAKHTALQVSCEIIATDPAIQSAAKEIVLCKRKDEQALQKGCHLFFTMLDGITITKGEPGYLVFEQECNLNEITNQKFENLKEYLNRRFLIPARKLEHGA